jgi:hypothetical protein
MKTYCLNCEENVLPEFGICPTCGRKLEGKKKDFREDTWDSLTDDTEWSEDVKEVGYEV